MDSGNSSSMQSSSGGDEQEYDSRSLFHHNNMNMNMNINMNMNMNMMMKPPPPQQQQLFSWASAPLVRSDFLSFTSAPGTSTAPPPLDPPPSQPSPPKATAGPSRNPKKRTRASRRAPTTVLTTDTTNFRAMVQEFTGIPDPPFSGSASSRRLDLLSTAGSSMRLAASLGPPLRPAPHRLGGLMINQQQLGAPGSGRSDPNLAFQTLIQQQPFIFPPPPAFGTNMGMSGLLSPPQPGNGLGFGSSSGPDHAGTSIPNNDYDTSQGNAEFQHN